jgi:hypothetical protein
MPLTFPLGDRGNAPRSLSVAVIATSRLHGGEWAGRWERWLVGEVLRAHDPTLPVEREAPLLRRLGTGVYVSAGTGDPGSLADARLFDGRLAALGIRHELRLLSGGHDGRFWRAQLPDALAYAFPA